MVEEQKEEENERRRAAEKPLSLPRQLRRAAIAACARLERKAAGVSQSLASLSRDGGKRVQAFIHHPVAWKSARSRSHSYRAMPRRATFVAPE